MKRLLLALAFILAPSIAFAQCNGVFPNNTVCGNITGASNTPRPTNPSAFLGAAGGTNGQIQYNNAGALGGFSPTPNLPLIGSASSPNITTGTKTGNTNNFATSTGSLTNGHCIKIDASGNLIDSGAICGGGGVIYVLPSDYNITCNGSTDVSAAFQSMVNGSTGKTIFLPAGPACVLGTSITIPSNTTIIGAGWDASVKCTMVNLPCFSATDVSDVVLTNFWIQGTNAANNWATANVGAFAYTMDASALTSLSNIQFTHMKLTSFNSTYWVAFSLTASTQVLFNVHFDDNTIITDANSPPISPVNGESNYAFVFYSGTTASMRNSTFSRNNINAVGACFGFIFFGAVLDSNIDQNNIQSPGQTATTHCNNADGSTVNAYGISVYDLYANGNYSQNYTVNNNIISVPYASGIYIAGGSTNELVSAVVNGNVINGQTSNDNASLPRAAIALNAIGDIAVVGNALNGNFGGVDVSAVTVGAVLVADNKCYTGNGDANAHCFRITPGAGATHIESVSFIGNSTTVAGTGPAFIIANSSSANKFGILAVSNNVIIAPTSALNAGGQFISSQFALTNNIFNGGGTINISSISGNFYVFNNANLAVTATNLPTTATNGSQIYVSDGAPASACTGSSTGSNAFRQNGAWKCF